MRGDSPGGSGLHGAQLSRVARRHEALGKHLADGDGEGSDQQFRLAAHLAWRRLVITDRPGGGDERAVAIAMIVARDVAGVVGLTRRVEAVDRPGRHIAGAGAGAAIIAEDERRGAGHRGADRLGQFGFRNRGPWVGAGRKHHKWQDGKNGSQFDPCQLCKKMSHPAQPVLK